MVLKRMNSYIDTTYDLLVMKYHDALEKAQNEDTATEICEQIDLNARKNFLKAKKILLNLPILLEKLKDSDKTDKYKYRFNGVRYAIYVAISNFLHNEKAFVDNFDNFSISFAYEILKNYNSLERNFTEKKNQLIFEKNKVLSQALLDSAQIEPHKTQKQIREEQKQFDGE